MPQWCCDCMQVNLCWPSQLSSGVACSHGQHVFGCLTLMFKLVFARCTPSPGPAPDSVNMLCHGMIHWHDSPSSTIRGIHEVSIPTELIPRLATYMEHACPGMQQAVNCTQAWLINAQHTLLSLTCHATTSTISVSAVSQGTAHNHHGLASTIISANIMLLVACLHNHHWQLQQHQLT